MQSFDENYIDIPPWGMFPAVEAEEPHWLFRHLFDENAKPHPATSAAPGGGRD